MTYLKTTIDLHGYTIDEAYKIFRQYSVLAYEKGIRKIKVITGKGAKGNGQIRQELPKWASLLSFVQSVEEVKHSGGGAFYIVLKRHKTLN